MEDRSSSPVKACLIAPSFSSSPSEQNASRLTTKVSSSTSASSSSSSNGNNAAIDNVVKKAYKKIKREREVRRSKLVSDVLCESRDKVVHEILFNSIQHVNNGKEIISANSSNNINGTKKRKSKYTNNSPNNGRRKKKSRTTNNDDDGASLINNDGLEMPSNGANLKSPPEIMINGTSSHIQQQKVLVFPRLPSNNCPSIHQTVVFPPSLVCQPCQAQQSEEDDSFKEEAASAAMPPPLNLAKNNECSISIKTRSSNNNKQSSSSTSKHAYKPLYIEGSHPPLPKSSSLIFLKSDLAVPDEPSLSHVPYFGDGDNEDIYSELFDTTERERLYEFGPKYQEIETLECIDAVLRLLSDVDECGKDLFENLELYNEIVGDDKKIQHVKLQKKKGTKKTKKKGKSCGSGSSVVKQQADVEKLSRIHLVLSELANVDLERVHERHALCFFMPREDDVESNISNNVGCYVRSEEAPESSDNGDIKNTTTNGSKKESPPAIASIHKANSDTTVPVPYTSIMDSYRDLLCRRCFTYDCNIHGNLPKANITLLGELAVQKELDGQWTEVSFSYCGWVCTLILYLWLLFLSLCISFPDVVCSDRQRY